MWTHELAVPVQSCFGSASFLLLIYCLHLQFYLFIAVPCGVMEIKKVVKYFR